MFQKRPSTSGADEPVLIVRDASERVSAFLDRLHIGKKSGHFYFLRIRRTAGAS
jgi:hypothetical protein